MDKTQLEFENLINHLLKPYKKRGSTESSQFLRWVLEHLYRLDIQQADDACVDAKQDKGVDGILVNDTIETIHIFQSKVRQKTISTLGDTDLKEFVGSLEQFASKENIEAVLNGQANSMLKQAIRRENIGEKVDLGYRVQGVFCCNAPLNKDGKDYLEMTQGLIVYDANRIADEYVDIDKKSGIEENFDFDVSDSEVIKYQTAEHVLARIFLASALQMTKMNGISNQELFSHNVRLALGNTKVNKSLVESIKIMKSIKTFRFITME